jgi:hypothetical protein
MQRRHPGLRLGHGPLRILIVFDVRKVPDNNVIYAAQEQRFVKPAPSARRP